LWVYSNIFCNKNANITAIDIAANETLYETIRTLGGRGFHTKLLLEHSFTIANKIENNIDLLHIDSQHDYDTVATEFKLYYPKVISGGVILFHDTALHSGPIQLMKEIKDQYNLKSFKASKASEACGITLLQK
jgi:cephalosporin hydroxylase